MADLEFVDPITGVALGAYAFGTVAAGVESDAFAARLRYKVGQSGSGLYQTAVVLEVSENGGSTWRTDLAEFTIAVTAVVNTPNDPEFYGAPISARRTTRLELAPMRAGSAYDFAIKCSPVLRTGATTSALLWRIGVLYNESSQSISLIPDAPTGVLTGLGDASISEWVTAPTLTPGTGEVTLGDCDYVFEGVALAIAGAAVTLSQTAASGTLTSGQEYVAVLSVGSAGTVVTTKGYRTTAGSAITPAYPAGNLPIGVVRVPYGGVIVTTTVVALTGRLVVSDGGGLVAAVAPGRATMPGYLLTPRNVQRITLPDDATTAVYLDSQGVPSLVGGVPLATPTTAGGVITGIVDDRLVLSEGRRPLVPISPLTADLNADSHRITSIPEPGLTTNEYDAANWGSVMQRPAKAPVKIICDADVATLSGLQTLDGIALVDTSAVLLTAQTDPTENGKWLVHSGAWERHPDAKDGYYVYAGITVYCRAGTYARQVWIQTSDDPAAQVWEVMVALP